jgi:hypothetical protein
LGEPWAAVAATHGAAAHATAVAAERRPNCRREIAVLDIMHLFITG